MTVSVWLDSAKRECRHRSRHHDTYRVRETGVDTGGKDIQTDGHTDSVKNLLEFSEAKKEEGSSKL